MAECRATRVDCVEVRGIASLSSRWWWELWVATGVLAFALLAGLVLIALSSTGTLSDADVGADVSAMGVSVATVVRDASFDFVDHGLRIAGGYSLRSAPRIAEDASFDFLDHELRYAGGYTLRPVARTPGDCACPLLDDELRLTRGDGLLPAAASTLASAGASGPVRYIPWVIMNVLEGLSRSGGLSIADASDPLQVTSLEAKEAARRARSTAAYAARYQGVADLFAAEGEDSVVRSAGLSIADASDPLQVTSLEAEEAARRERSMAAWAARYQGMADALAAESMVHSAGLTIADASDPLQVTSLEAKEAERRARSTAAYAARYQGMADALAMGSLVRSSGLSIADASDPLQVASLEAKEAARRARSIAAHAARYQGMADFYMAGRGFCACTPIDPRIDRAA